MEAFHTCERGVHFATASANFSNGSSTASLYRSQKGGLPDRKFGFRSTGNAFSTVTKIAKAAMEANQFYAVVTLDANYAFNSTKWCKRIEALAKLGTPKNLVHIEFLREMLLCYDSDDGP